MSPGETVVVGANASSAESGGGGGGASALPGNLPRWFVAITFVNTIVTIAVLFLVIVVLVHVFTIDNVGTGTDTDTDTATLTGTSSSTGTSTGTSGGNGDSLILRNLATAPSDPSERLYILNGELNWSGAQTSRVLPGDPNGLARYDITGEFIESFTMNTEPLYIPVPINAPAFVTI